MTYAEQEEVSIIERTCDEMRKDNIDLKSEIHAMHKDLCKILTLNTLGKTTEIANIINSILTYGTR